jgi:hypothetical protein
MNYLDVASSELWMLVLLTELAVLWWLFWSWFEESLQPPYYC